MSNTAEFIITDGVLKKYNGSGGDVEIPTGVAKIAAYAFAERKALKSVTIPEGVESIGKEAFAWCYALKRVSFPATLSEIGQDAFVSNEANYIFNDGSPLVTVTAPKGSKGADLARESGMLFLPSDAVLEGDFYLDGETLIKYDGPGGIVSVPNGVKAIGYAAFAGCHGLTGITIPDSVEQIGKFAFLDCVKLESVSLPAGLKKLEPATFFGCGELKDITLPDSLEIIGDDAFCWCDGLEKVVLPRGVTRIGRNAFRFSVCGSFISKHETPDLYVHHVSAAAFAAESAGYAVKSLSGTADPTDAEIPASVTWKRESTHVPESILWTLHDLFEEGFTWALQNQIGDGQLSAVEVFCKEDQREQAAACFRQAFDAAAEKESRELECDKAEQRTIITDTGFFASLSFLPWKPLEEALQAVRELFPRIRYAGMICLVYSDRWGGVMQQYEISGGMRPLQIYGFIGEQLAVAVQREEFWDHMEEYHLCTAHQFTEMIDFFRTYIQWTRQESIDRLQRIAEENEIELRVQADSNWDMDGLWE